MSEMKRSINITAKNYPDINLDLDKANLSESQIAIINRIKALLEKEQSSQIDAHQHFSTDELAQIKEMRANLKLAVNSAEDNEPPEIRVVRGGPGGDPFVW